MKHFLLLLLLFFVAYYLLKAAARLLKIFTQKKESYNEFGSTNKPPKNEFTFSGYNKKKRFEKNDGEYVDFEEVK